MVNISAELPLNVFAVKIAERTGLPPQSVVHVLATAMILASEACGSDITGTADPRCATSAGAIQHPLLRNSNER